LFGDGSTLAIAGAYQLAQALAEVAGEPRAAFARYQAVHSRLVASKQKNLGRMAARLVPKTATGIWFSTRVFWRGIEGVGAVVRFARKLRAKQA